MCCTKSRECSPPPLPALCSWRSCDAGFVEIELEPDTAAGYCEMPLQSALDAGCAAIGHFPRKDEPRLRAMRTASSICREITFVVSEGSVRLGTTPESVVAVPYVPLHR